MATVYKPSDDPEAEYSEKSTQAHDSLAERGEPQTISLNLYELDVERLDQLGEAWQMGRDDVVRRLIQQASTDITT